MKQGRRSFAAICLLYLAGCADPSPGDGGGATAAAGRVECSEPRPQFCTRDYRPVCATRDNGVRCVTTPCDSTEQRTYSNGCSACADAAVYFHVPGACDEADGT